MSSEIISFDELFEIVRQPDNIEFDLIPSIYMNSTGVYVPVGEVHGVEKADSLSNFGHNSEHIIIGELLLAVGLPVLELQRNLHFYKD